MTIEPIAEHRLRVWLTEDDLEQWGLDAGPSPMGRVRRLVRQVCAAAGWPEGDRVTAELIPVDGGGLLLISPWTVEAGDAPAVYHLADGDALLDLILQWGYIEEQRPLCSLYARDGGYDLAVYADGPLSPRQQSLLWEYGTPAGSGAGAAARCGEYGTLIRAGSDLYFTERAPHPPERGDPWS